MNFKPFGDKMLVKKVEHVKVSRGGIIIPDQAMEAINRGTVVAVGDGYLSKDLVRVPLGFKGGETVVFRPHSGMEVKLDGEYFLILREEDVVGTILEPVVNETPN